MKIPTIYNEYSKKDVQVLEIWESFTGWYWYIVEKDGDYAYGLVDGFEKEWGSIYLPELKALSKQYKVWKVKKIDIPYSKNIKMVEKVVLKN